MKLSSRFRVSICVAAAAFAATTALSQSTTSQQPAATSVQPLRVTSRLVQVNVIVRHKGAPVTGLTKDDFTILDQNRPQKIANFSEQFLETNSAPQPTSGRAVSNSFFSNHFDPDSGTPHSVTLILLDALNTPRQDMANARAAIANFLGQIKPGDRIALYGLSTNLFVIHDFTSDAGSLLVALKQSKNGHIYNPSSSEVSPSSTGSDNIDAFMDSANQHFADMQTINRAEMTANVMAAIASSVVNIPGRKNLVWVSGSFPFQIGSGTSADDPAPNSKVPSLGGMSPNQSNAPGPNTSVQYRTFQKELEAASDAVNNANLAIYPVDARGLIGAANVSADMHSPLQNPGSSAARTRRPMSGSQPTPARENFDTLNELAEQTGGRAFYNTNDIQNSVRQAIDDARDSYVLDYYPSETQWDGSFHTIKVEVKRSGIEVRFRKGYFAMPDASTDALRTEQMVQDAMASPFQDTDLGLTAEVHGETSSGARQLSARIGIDASRMQFTKANEAWIGSVEIIWLQFASDGKPVSARKQLVALHLSPEEYQESRGSAVQVTKNVALKNEATKLRIVVRDIGTGSIGSVDVPLQKAFAAAPNPSPKN